ncbi:adhesion G-protein coupled receptor G7-like isoform X2 [Bolinopsis microptera]|uniref:adhesion G-protein coupled receptor G7-like isoform X2 n=1 Tax=Bolinopsis microptera TaxID=2820187 RepID=UPI003078F5E6
MTVVGVVVGNLLTPPSDLGDYDNLYKGLADIVLEWSDASIESCKEADTFRIDLSQQAACVDGNCRVAFILLYPEELDFQSISWTDTANEQKTTLRNDLTIETDEQFKIIIPEEVLLKDLTITFDGSVSICEVIVAGESADKYECPAGKFLKSNPVQCDLCSEGEYSDVAGLKECKQCAENEKTENTGEGNTGCTPCDYLQYSATRSSACSPCDGTSQNKAACFLSRDQTDNRVPGTFGHTDLRSLERTDEYAGYDIMSGISTISLQPGTFLIYSVVLIAKEPGDQSILESLTIDSCEKDTTLSFPAGTAVFTCEKSGLASLSVTTQSQITLKKMFVFGVPFNEASAPPGYRNTGTQFEICPPGSYSQGGQVTECTKCLDNQEQAAAGQTSCTNCNQGFYSNIGDPTCSKCGPDSPECKDACQSEEETNEIYGIYSWPSTSPGETATIKCAYNNHNAGKAFKMCDSSEKTFGESDFAQCHSKVHENINIINKEADKMASPEDQKAVSEHIESVTKKSSGIMNSDDVKMTSQIIDKLVEYDEATKLDEDVRNNIVKTVEGVLDSTSAYEIAKGDVASSMRNSVEKLSNKISKDSKDTEDNSPIYVKERKMGVIVSKTIGDDTSFTVSGDKSNYTNTDLATDKNSPVLFTVKVPANENKSPVTAILYDTPKFYPDKITVEDFSSALAAQFTSPNRSKKAPSRVVSMVTEIKYAESTGSVQFEDGKEIEMKYSVKEEKPRTHYKMHLKSSYDCVFYDTKTESWISGEESGCVTKEEIGSNGEKLVSCQCSHMTSFAVLMSFDSDYDPLEETVTSILLGISLGCLFFTIIAYLPAKDMLRTRSVRINLLLVTSLMFSIIIFYFMELVVTTDIKEDNARSETDTAAFPCVIVAFLMNYFWLCQMAWMVCEALVMYRALVSAVMDSHIHRYMLKFNLACWGIPLIFPIIGIIWGQTDFANPRTCFIRQKYGLVTFYGPVIFCILFNIFIFVRIAWSIFRKQSMETGKKPVSDLERKKKQFKFAITVMTLLGVAWIFGFFLIIKGDNTIWLRWLFIVFNSTQGIFIFILYVVMNDNLKKVWSKLLNIADSDKPSHSSVPYSRSKDRSEIVAAKGRHEPLKHESTREIELS